MIALFSICPKTAAFVYCDSIMLCTIGDALLGRPLLL